MDTTILGVPEVRVGDPQFDQLFLVNGLPVEVVQALFDAPTRRWLFEQFRSKEPTLGTREGSLTLGVPLRLKDGLWSLPASRPLPPAEVAYWLDVVLDLADRLAGSFDGYHEALARAQGPAAADRWVRSHVAAMQARESRGRRLRWLLLALLLFVVLVAVVLPLAIILGVSLLP